MLCKKAVNAVANPDELIMKDYIKNKNKLNKLEEVITKLQSKPQVEP